MVMVLMQDRGAQGGPPREQIAVLVSAIGAVGALGTAAFGLVDATKAISGGVSNVGDREREEPSVLEGDGLAGASSSPRSRGSRPRP
jgi:hypothetical protein